MGCFAIKLAKLRDVDADSTGEPADVGFCQGEASAARRCRATIGKSDCAHGAVIIAGDRGVQVWFEPAFHDVPPLWYGERAARGFHRKGPRIRCEAFPVIQWCDK